MFDLVKLMDLIYFKNAFHPARLLLLVMACLTGANALAQDEDQQPAVGVFRNNIRSVQLTGSGSQVTFPVMQLNSGEKLELNFDDMDADVKNYSYTFEMRNADWSPVQLGKLEYLKGFQDARISSYTLSSIALTNYTHYQAYLPDNGCMPSKAGNYLLKVFPSNDPDSVAFAVRMLVYDNKMPVSAQVQQPQFSNLFRTHQKIQFSVSTGAYSFTNPIQEVKVVIVQNWQWARAKYNLVPIFVRSTTLEYNTDRDAVFNAGKEWRWLDLRSFRFQSDRITHIDQSGNPPPLVYLRTDQSRLKLPYYYYADNNGCFRVETLENITASWQGDYGRVFFSYGPPDGEAFTGKDLYLYGALTNYALNDSARMRYNPQKRVYENSLLLKQGYYDYDYVLKDADGNLDFTATEGDAWETDNSYLVLVYYHPFGARADELVGLTTLHSRLNTNTNVQ